MRENPSQKTARLRREAKRQREAECAKYQIQDVLIFQTSQGVRHGHLVKKVGAFFTIRHPDGSCYTIEVEQVINKAVWCRWPGIAQTLIEMDSPHQALEMLERWVDVLAEIEQAGSADQKIAVRQLLAPLDYTKKVLTRCVDFEVFELKAESLEHQYALNSDRTYDDLVNYFKVTPRLVTPMDKPDEGFVWFRETLTGYAEQVEL